MVDAVESVKIAFVVTAEAVTVGGNGTTQAGGGSTPALGTRKKIFIHIKEQITHTKHLIQCDTSMGISHIHIKEQIT